MTSYHVGDRLLQRFPYTDDTEYLVVEKTEECYTVKTMKVGDQDFSDTNSTMTFSHELLESMDLEILSKVPVVVNSCTCETRDLMHFGCKCGWIDKERS